MLSQLKLLTLKLNEAVPKKIILFLVNLEMNMKLQTGWPILYHVKIEDVEPRTQNVISLILQ